jgi:ribosome-binding factor A
MSRRTEKAAEAVREVVSMAILTELNDPRVKDVTVTFVEVSADMRYAKVHVSVMGDETQQTLTLRGLQHAAGFLQAKIAKRIEIRYTPKLSFVLDEGVKKSIEVARILREVLPQEPAGADAETEGVTKNLGTPAILHRAQNDDLSSKPATPEAEISSTSTDSAMTDPE